MLDPSLPNDKSLERVSSLEPEGEILSPLEAIALSEDSYFHRFRQHVGWLIWESLTKDLLYSAIIPSVIVGLIALLGGDVTLTTAFYAVLSFLALFFAFTLKHGIEAPAEIDKILRNRLVVKEGALALEKARNAEPKLAGRIDCLDHNVAWDLEYYGVDKAMPLKLKVTFALNVSLWNETAAATTVSDFTLWVLWQEGQYQADKLPVQGYSVERGFPRSEHRRMGV